MKIQKNESKNWLKKHLQKFPSIIKKRWKLSAIVLLVGIGLGYYLLQSQAAKNPEINTVSPAKRDLKKTLTVAGVVDAKQKARVRFASGGKIVYLGASEGGTVNKGQTLATIDAKALEKQLDSSLNTYMQERWLWENTLDKNENEILDDTERRIQDISQFELNKKVLQVEMQDIAVRESALYAPFSGILTVVPATVTGVQLGPTDYFELVNPNSLIFRAQVDENDIAGVLLGLPTIVSLDSYPDQELNSTVNYISYTSAQSTSGTIFFVEMPLPDSDLNTHRIGMNGDVAIILEEKSDVLSIPIEAIRERDNRVFVDVLIAENVSEEREIKTGLETDDYIEVVSGLSESDRVVLPE